MGCTIVEGYLPGQADTLANTGGASMRSVDGKNPTVDQLAGIYVEIEEEEHIDLAGYESVDPDEGIDAPGPPVDELAGQYVEIEALEETAS
jgi:hypothetical protein